MTGIPRVEPMQEQQTSEHDASVDVSVMQSLRNEEVKLWKVRVFAFRAWERKRQEASSQLCDVPSTKT